MFRCVLLVVSCLLLVFCISLFVLHCCMLVFVVVCISLIGVHGVLFVGLSCVVCVVSCLVC